MASLQIIKSPFSFAKSKVDFNFSSCGKRILRLSNANRSVRSFGKRSITRVSCKLQESDSQNNGEEPPESLFMKELRRRGMTPTSLLEEANRTVYEDEDAKLREEDRGFSQRNTVSTDAGRNLVNQREQSMALNSEGLEGLIPRAKLLLTLGGTFFLGFWPLILITVTFFVALYLYFGPTFIHDGSNSRVTPPQYIDPYALLEEERLSQIAPPLN